MSISNTKINIARGTLISAAMLAFAISLFLFWPNDFAVSEEPDIQTNQYGQTFGVPTPGNDGVLVFPDLVRTRAENGEMGYVDFDEMNDIATRSFEEAGAAPFIAAFQEATAEYYGVELLTAEQAETCVEIANYAGNYSESDEVVFGKLLAEPLAAALKAGELDQGRARELVLGSLRAGTIPEEMATRMIDESMKAASGFTGVATSSDAVALCEAALSKGAVIPTTQLQEIQSTNLFVSEEVYEEIYRSVQRKTCISIPVYAEDGKTVIGDFLLDRI